MKYIAALSILALMAPSFGIAGGCGADIKQDVKTAARLYNQSESNDMKVISLLQNAAGKCPDWALPHNILGMALNRQGKFKEAVGAFQSALRADPKDFGIYLRLGDAYRQIGKEVHAVRFYVKGTQILSTDINLSARYGTTLTKYESRRDLLLAKTLYRDETQLKKHLDRSVAIRVGVSPKIDTHIEFETDRADIKPDWTAQLDAAANVLSGSEMSAYKFVVQGHTDERGSHAHNDDLSLRRARSVIDYLVQKGAPGSDLIIDGKGKRRNIPCAAGETTEDCWRKNRRVIFVSCKASDSVSECLKAADAN